MFSRSLWADSIILSIMLINNAMASTAPLCDLGQGHWGAEVKGGETVQLRWEYLLSFGGWHSRAPLYQPLGQLLHTHHTSGHPSLLGSNLLHHL